MGIPTGKIEARAIEVLQAIINEHPTMDAKINSCDKELSWDGDITIFKDDNKGQTKENFYFKAPIQVKGHNDAKNEYINKKMISYSVSLHDLHAYASGNGAIYFQIFLGEKKNEIFYCSLFPSKLADIIDNAEKKGNKSSVNITFIKLKKDPDELYKVIRQFCREVHKQGGTYTDIVKKRIRVDEVGSIAAFTLNTDDPNPHSIVQGVADGNICLYGKRTEADEFFKPIECSKDIFFFANEDVEANVCVGNEIFYDHYQCYSDTSGNRLIRLSSNLELDFTRNKICITGHSTIRELVHDAVFLFMSREIGNVSIHKAKFNISKDFMTKKFEGKLHYYIDLYDTLNKIGFSVDEPISTYTQTHYDQFAQLVVNRFQAEEKLKPNERIVYEWKYGDKYYPLIFAKADNQSVIITIYDTSSKWAPLVQNGNHSYKIPLFLQFSLDVFCELYRYDYDAFKEQIDYSDINEYTLPIFKRRISYFVYISYFKGDEKIMDLAKYMYKKIKPLLHEPDEFYVFGKMIFEPDDLPSDKPIHVITEHELSLDYMDDLGIVPSTP